MTYKEPVAEEVSVFVHLASVLPRLNLALLGKLDAISSMPW
jgi:hypothetical protein